MSGAVIMRIDPQKLLFSCTEAFCVGVAFAVGAAVVISVLFGLFVFFAGDAKAAEVQIPRAALQHRDTLIRASRVVWGLDAPVSIFAAQIHTESWWKNDTVSSAGAQGLAQFMPSTAKWLPTVAPEVGKPAPFNPGWALRACVTYDKYLWDRLAAKGTQKKTLTPCDRMAFALSAYNGGMGWTNRDRNLAAKRGLDPDRYFGSVETVNAGRRASAKQENQRYVSFIFERQAAYVKAGWGPGVSCED